MKLVTLVQYLTCGTLISLKQDYKSCFAVLPGFVGAESGVPGISQS